LAVINPALMTWSNVQGFHGQPEVQAWMAAQTSVVQVLYADGTVEAVTVNSLPYLLPGALVTGPGSYPSQPGLETGVITGLYEPQPVTYLGEPPTVYPLPEVLPMAGDQPNGYSNYTDYGGGASAASFGPVLIFVAGIGAIAAKFLLTWGTRIAGTGSRYAIRPLWNNLPLVLRNLLTSLGILEGAEFILDVAGYEIELGLPLEGLGTLVPTIPGLPPALGGGGGGGLSGPGVLGSWVANGITFYRLSDGRLAVQNKHGKWKTWRPKRPIVLYAGGAADLKTLLRADGVLNTQAKRIRKYLDRRAPRPRRAPQPKVIEVSHTDVTGGHH